jgi:predicted Zn-ribbon and HTH transcriptional regulator
MIRCGKCKGEHGTVSEVRSCYGLPAKPELLSDPREGNPRRAEWNLPTGQRRYAITSLTGNNDLDFFLVSRPEDGKWKGWTFVKRVIGGKPDASVPNSQVYRILMEIEKDPETASATFGKSLGVCSKCGIHLTDAESRAAGRGPDCRAKYGMAG